MFYPFFEIHSTSYFNHSKSNILISLLLSKTHFLFLSLQFDVSFVRLIIFYMQYDPIKNNRTILHGLTACTVLAFFKVKFVVPLLPWLPLAKLLTFNTLDFKCGKKVPGNNQHFFLVTTNTFNLM